MLKSAKLMLVYAGFLVACGFAAFALSNFESRAMTALIAGGGSAVLMTICAVMASMLHRNRPVGMIGIHVGLVLPLLLAGVFGWRAYGAFQKYQAGGEGAPAGHLPYILGVLMVGSIVAFVMILKTRPKPEARGG